MADSYLNLAEDVIAREQRPLRPREVIKRAYLDGLLPPHLFGSRQDKTMHARLSEDISVNPEKSRFYRTAAGTFYLKSLSAIPDAAGKINAVYQAPPRRKELIKDAVLVLDDRFEGEITTGVISLTIPDIERAFSQGSYSYKLMRDVNADDSEAVVHSFLVVYRENMVLSFRSGKFYPSTDPIFGQRSIGIGGAVLEKDRDIIYDSMFGIIENAIDELGYGIGLPRRLAERARYQNEVRPYLAVALDRSPRHPRVIHVVLAYRCPDEFTPSKAALSVNDLRWVNASNTLNSLGDYDSTSQFLFEHDYVRDIASMSSECG